MGNLNRIQVKAAAVEIDGDLEMVTIPETTGTFLYGCNLGVHTNPLVLEIARRFFIHGLAAALREKRTGLK
jgi:hypothetical protein